MRMRNRIPRETNYCLVATSNENLDRAVAAKARREYATGIKTHALINGKLVPITPKQCEAYQKWFPQIELF